MIDTFSHYLTLSVLKTKKATSIVEAFIDDIIVHGFLPSKIILSDNGSEFQNGLIHVFIQQLRKTFKLGGPDGEDALKHVFVAVYLPQQNPVECVNRFIKAMLKILVNQPGRSTLDWPKFVC